MKLALVVLLAAASGRVLVGADPVADVRQRLLDLLCLPSPAVNASALAAQAAGYAAALLPNGTWADVDYHDAQDRAIWKTIVHLQRALAMLEATVWPPSPVVGDARIFNASRAALLTWSEQDWSSDNWWWDIVNVPQQYSCAYLLLGTAPPQLQAGFPSSFERAKGLEIMLRAAWWNASLGYEVTGANLAWMVQVQLVRGTLPFALNETALEQGFTRLWQEAKVVNRSLLMDKAQGIQHDWSYQFHGPQLQVGSYGQDFSGDMLLGLAVAAGTPWAPPAPAVAVLCGYWARGQAVLSVGDSFDWTSVGRQVSRPTLAAEFGLTLNATQIRAAAAQCPDAAEGAAVAAWADRIQASPGAAPLRGSAHFWCSDTTVHRPQPGWVAVVHTHSTRTRVPECGNGENLRGRYMGEGVLSVYATACGGGGGASPRSCGQEYAGIFPLLDWSLLPGVLAAADIPVPRPQCAKDCCWESEVASLPFVGGASDGVAAVAAMDTDTYNITSRRAWLLFSASVLALTAGADDPSGAHTLRTGVAQQWLRQAGVSVGFANGSVASLPDGVHALPDARWLHAEGTGWLPFAPALAHGASVAVPTLDSGDRTGNWATIGASSAPASGRTLRLALDHGANVSRGGSGAGWGYLVVPNVTAEAMPAVASADGGVELIANSALLQAAADVARRTVGAVFWPAPGCGGGAPSGACAGGGFAWASRDGAFVLALNASAPCLLTYREDARSGTLAVAVSNPDTPGGLLVRVTLDRALQPSATCAAAAGPTPGTSTLEFALPADALSTMGAAVVQNCSAAAAAAPAAATRGAGLPGGADAR
jgi:chondroitin AC lyase